MNKAYISVSLRRFVEQRANNRCEYCLLPGAATFFPHEIDHVIAEKHGGKTDVSCGTTPTDRQFALVQPLSEPPPASETGDIFLWWGQRCHSSDPPPATQPGFLGQLSMRRRILGPDVAVVRLALVRPVKPQPSMAHADRHAPLWSLTTSLTLFWVDSIGRNLKSRSVQHVGPWNSIILIASG